MVDAGPETYSCDDVQTIAFDSHVQCYVTNGFCELAFDLKHPLEVTSFVYDLMHVYQVKDFASFIAIKQIASVFKECNFPSDEVLQSIQNIAAQ